MRIGANGRRIGPNITREESRHRKRWVPILNSNACLKQSFDESVQGNPHTAALAFRGNKARMSMKTKDNDRKSKSHGVQEPQSSEREVNCQFPVAGGDVAFDFSTRAFDSSTPEN